MRTLRVLLVDDEEDLVSAMVERLRYRGIEARYALDGQRAIEMTEGEDFDVVVLDLKLPGMSGIEVQHIIRKEHPGLPILLITGHGAPAAQLGLDPEEHGDILEKPVDLAVLVERIREAATDL